MTDALPAKLLTLIQKDLILWHRCDMCGAPRSHSLSVAINDEGGNVAIFHLCGTCVTHSSGLDIPGGKIHIIEKSIKDENIFDFSL